MEDSILDGHSIRSLLEKPELLKGIPLKKVQSLKNTFPYSANLQLLYAFRFFLDKKSIPPEILEAVAMRITNRQQLQYWFSKFNNYISQDQSQQSDLQDEPTTSKKKKKKRRKKKKKKIKEGLRWRKLVENQQPVSSPEEMADSASSPFLRWLYNLGNTDSPGYRDLEKELIKLSKQKESSIPKIKEPKKEWVDESLHEDKQITSEALADILVNQGHYEKAREMYERLSLKFPEKIAFFAAKIEDLSRKITDKKD